MCWGPIGPRQIIAMQPLIKKFKCFFNYKLNVKTGFLDPENTGKDTKSDFLSQILRKLWGIEYFAHLAQTAISFFAYMTEKLLKGDGKIIVIVFGSKVLCTNSMA